MSLLLSRSADVHVLRHAPLHPKITLIVNELFNIESASPHPPTFTFTAQSSCYSDFNIVLPSSSQASLSGLLTVSTDEINEREFLPPLLLEEKLLTHLTQTFKTSLEIRISGFDTTSSMSLSRMNHSYIDLLETLNKLYTPITESSNPEISRRDSDKSVHYERIKTTCEKDLCLFFDTSIKEEGIYHSLLHLDLSLVKKEKLIHLSHVYQYMINHQHNQIQLSKSDTEIMVKMKEKASECVLMGVNISKVGLYKIAGLLKETPSEERVFEMLVVLQNYPFQSLVILES